MTRRIIRINPETDLFLSVDAMSTFTPGGELAVIDGDQIVDPINEVLAMFPPGTRVAVNELHPPGHISFASSFVGYKPRVDEVTYEEAQLWTPESNRLSATAAFTLEQAQQTLSICRKQRLYEDHAVRGSRNAIMHPGIHVNEFDFLFTKGTRADRDSHSAIMDNTYETTGVGEFLLARRGRRIFVGGLEKYICVGWTLAHLRDRGFEPYLIEECTRTLDPDGKFGVRDAGEELFRRKAVQVVHLDQLRAAV